LTGIKYYQNKWASDSGAFFIGKGRRLSGEAALKKQTGKPVKKDMDMILFISVNFKKLIDMGRSYPWPKPARCPICGQCRLWGHGFVWVFFDGYNQAVEIKRCRCPDCGSVLRFRPEGYFTRFQAKTEKIRSSIASKSQAGKWEAGISRTRQRHWYRALCRKIKAHLTDTWDKGVLAAFDYLVSKGLVPVSRSI
jgi:hypothetical protein